MKDLKELNKLAEKVGLITHASSNIILIGSYGKFVDYALNYGGETILVFTLHAIGDEELIYEMTKVIPFDTGFFTVDGCTSAWLKFIKEVIK